MSEEEQSKPTKRIHQTLDEDLHAELKAAAAKRKMTLQEYIERLLRQALDSGGLKCV
jgi:predicted HicB family RNase H-like nuclease